MESHNQAIVSNFDRYTFYKLANARSNGSPRVVFSVISDFIKALKRLYPLIITAIEDNDTQTYVNGSQELLVTAELLGLRGLVRELCYIQCDSVSQSTKSDLKAAYTEALAFLAEEVPRLSMADSEGNTE
jgi:hypothetical protein